MAGRARRPRTSACARRALGRAIGLHGADLGRRSGSSPRVCVDRRSAVDPEDDQLPEELGRRRERGGARRRRLPRLRRRAGRRGVLLPRASSSARCATGAASWPAGDPHRRSCSASSTSARRTPAFLRAARRLRLRAVRALQRTGSLYPCIALHCLNNSIAFGVSQDWTLGDRRCCSCALAVAARSRSASCASRRRRAGTRARRGRRLSAAGGPRGPQRARLRPRLEAACTCGYIAARLMRRSRLRPRGRRSAAGPAAGRRRTAPPAAPKLSLHHRAVEPRRRPATALTRQDVARARRHDARTSPGQTAVVRFYRGGSRLAQVAGRARAVGDRPLGLRARALHLRASRAGSTVRASHRAHAARSPTLVAKRAARAGPRRRSARPGSRGPLVRAAAARTSAARGYVVGRAGLFDARTARAVLAFRKVTGMRRTTAASRAVIERLARGGGRFRVRFPSHGKHVEADLSRQVIALIRGVEGRADLPDELGRAGDADDPRLVPRLPQDAGLQRQGDVLLELLHPRLRDPRLRVGAARTRPATAACACRSRTRSRSTTGCGAATGSTSTRRAAPLSATSSASSAVHPAARVRRALAVGAVALGEDPLDLVERVRGAQLARVGARERRASRGRPRAPGAARRRAAGARRGRRGGRRSSPRRAPRAAATGRRARASWRASAWTSAASAGDRRAARTGRPSRAPRPCPAAGAAARPTTGTCSRAGRRPTTIAAIVSA